MANRRPRIVELFTLIPNELSNDPRYCSRLFWEWEDAVATPALKKKGWDVGRWYTIGQDSFSPLGRACIIRIPGQVIEVFYG